MNGYNTISREYISEMTVKGSRFISILNRCTDEDSVPVIIKELTRRFPDATHYCYACIYGGPLRKERSSDNGEPSGTAGKPILNVLKGSGLTDVMCVVIRYFGGTLLGTGGLVHTYSESASMVVKDVERITFTACARFSFKADYSMYSAIESKMSRMFARRPECEYSDRVYADVFVREEDAEMFAKRFEELTERKVQLTNSGIEYIML